MSMRRLAAPCAEEPPQRRSQCGQALGGWRVDMAVANMWEVDQSYLAVSSNELDAVLVGLLSLIGGTAHGPCRRCVHLHALLLLVVSNGGLWRGFSLPPLSSSLARTVPLALEHLLHLCIVAHTRRGRRRRDEVDDGCHVALEAAARDVAAVTLVE